MVEALQLRVSGAGGQGVVEEDQQHQDSLLFCAGRNRDTLEGGWAGLCSGRDVLVARTVEDEHV